MLSRPDAKTDANLTVCRSGRSTRSVLGSFCSTDRRTSRTSAGRSTGPTERRATVSPGLRDGFWWQGTQVGFKAVVDCIEAFSETEFTEDLRRFDVPRTAAALMGKTYQIGVDRHLALRTAKMVRGAMLRVVRGSLLPDGTPYTEKARINADLLAFLQA